MVRTKQRVLERPKSREFVYPIGHIHRHLVQTSPSISHEDEPTYFEQMAKEEQSHYRTEFKYRPCGAADLRCTSPHRRHKPQPLELFHIKRLRSGLACDVRSKLSHRKKDINLLGISKSAPSTEVSSWTRDVHRAFDVPTTKNQAYLPPTGPRKPICIVPACSMTSTVDGKDTPQKIDHWLPGIGLKYSSFAHLRQALGGGRGV